MAGTRVTTACMILGACVCAGEPLSAGEVYKADFEGRAGREWSHADTSTAPRPSRRFLGRFGNDSVSLTLGKLPPHKFLTVKFELFLFDTWDGDESLAHDGVLIGPDQWGLRVAGGPTLIHTTFHNRPGGPARKVTQAYPTQMGHGAAEARTGAAEKNTLGPSFSPSYGNSVYRMSYTFPHGADSIRLNFYGLNLEGAENEGWGIDNMSVSAAASHPSAKAADKALEALWEELVGDDLVKSERAVWALVCAGDRAAALIEKRFPRGRRGGADDKKIARLIAELDSENWKTRETASTELTRIGAKALPALRAELARTKSTEVRLRIERILAEAAKTGATIDPIARSRMRALRVLHIMATQPARKLTVRLTGTQTGPAALRPGSRWEGVRQQSGRPNFPMVMIVQQRQGQTVHGILQWPGLGGARSKFKGRMVDNRLELTGYEVIAGARAGVPAHYEGRLVGQTFTGSCRTGENAPWAGFQLRRVPQAAGGRK